jgi:hypothetical protein
MKWISTERYNWLDGAEPAKAAAITETTQAA